VMSETFQGVGPDFLPVDYARKLEAFLPGERHRPDDGRGAGRLRTHGPDVCLRALWIKPDLIACGKGISSSLPLSAVIGRRDILELYPPGSMTSTHSGSPLCVAAALANVRILKQGPYVKNSARLGEILFA